MLIGPSSIKRTFFTWSDDQMAFGGAFQPLKRREFTRNASNCPLWVLSKRTILTLSCR